MNGEPVMYDLPAILMVFTVVAVAILLWPQRRREPVNTRPSPSGPR